MIRISLPPSLPVVLLLGACASTPPGESAEREVRASADARGGLAAVPLADLEMPSPPTTELVEVEVDGLPTSLHAVDVARSDGSAARIYLSDSDGLLGERKPLLVWCEGSGAQSVFQRYPQGLSAGLFGYLAQAHGEHFHIAVVEKRGLGFGASVEQPGTAEGASREYLEHATWEGRVGDGCLALDALLAHPNVDPSLVLVMGHSEGGDIAAGIAALRPSVTHVATLAGAGPCQWAELLVLARRNGAAAGMSPDEVEAQIAWHEAEYAKILANPDSIEDFFYAHPYRRWSSFGARPPIESLLATDAAIYVAQGTADQSVPIESLDLVEVELMRHGRTDAVVRRYPGADHGFSTPEDTQQMGILHALDDAVAWATGEGGAE